MFARLRSSLSQTFVFHRPKGSCSIRWLSANRRPSPYDIGMDKNKANYVPLSPLSFIERSANVYPDKTAVIYGEQQWTWTQTYRRCRQLGSALAKRGLGRGDTVAVMLPNVPAIFESHFGVAMCGGVLNTLNTRLDGEAIAFMLDVIPS